jgi:hypothetical protein
MVLAHNLLREFLQAGADRGLTRAELAREAGVPLHEVYGAAKRLGVVFPAGKRGPSPGLRDPKRAEQMVALHAAGKTLEEIGDVYGVTRERVRQILKRNGVSRDDGGIARRVREKKHAAKHRRDMASLKKWGCSWDEYKALSRGPRSPSMAFIQQRRNARARGVEWQLTLWQWWTIWQKSGHWAGRGRGSGFGMCRYNDVGPYAVGNVFIATGRENSSRGGSKKGLPVGVTRRHNRFVAHASVNGIKKHLGSFATPEIAHAAYLAAISQPQAAA